MGLCRLAADVYAIDLLPPAACAALVRDAEARALWRLADEPLAYASGSHGPQGVSRAKLLALGEDAALFAPVEQVIEGVLKPLASGELGLDLPRHWGLHLLRTGEGETGSLHRDNGSPRHRLREYSLLLYLNDDVLGGHTLFDFAASTQQRGDSARLPVEGRDLPKAPDAGPSAGTLQQPSTMNDDNTLAVQPRCGQALLFRSSLVHGGTKVHRGVKYTLLGFLGREAPPDDAYEGWL